jgi:hypothetical protein
MQRQSKWILAAVGMVMFLCPLAVASGQTSRPTVKRKTAVKTVKKDMKPEKIRGLYWHPSLEGAIAANKKIKGAGKPIFFLRMLGDLKGKT